MLTISKRARYGLRAMLYLAQKNQVASTREIARAEDIPIQFLEQIIHDLRKQRLVDSKRGAQGGYSLTRPSNQISMGDIVRPLEEEISLAGCLSQTAKHCSRQKHCLAKKGWEDLQKRLLQSMDETSLADLVQRGH